MSYVAMKTTHGSGEWRVALSDYERVLHEVTETTMRFISFTTDEGVEVTLRRDTVESIALVSDAAEAAIAARMERDKLAGDL